ncbi:hypothetical protein BDR26DRAFT_104099 [Obelidium mucronatum]|nr:hypothetical protein BDR26DRAFT_104099 [Obelidium mucronatum]
MNLFVKSVLSKWIKTGYELYVVKSVAINAENWKKQISSLAPGSSLLTVDQYMALSFFLEEMKDSRSIIELNLWLLSVKADKKLNACMIDSFLKYKRLLCYMGEASNVAKTFWENKQSFTVTASILDNRFVSFLSSFSAFLPSEYLDAFLHETLPPTSHAKDSITEFNEIRNLKDTEESIFSAVSNLSFRYASSKEMVDRIFKYSLTTLSKISKENSDVFTQKRVQSIVGVLQGVNHQGRFLDKHIGDFLSSSLDLTPGAKLDSFIGEPWMIHFLVQLLLAHCCSVETILMRFLLPVISHQFGTSKPDHVLRFLTVIGVLQTLLVVGEDGDNTGHKFTDLELQALKGVRRSSFDQRELFSALFDIIFKLQTIRDRFESIVSSAKTQDTATINQSLDLVKKTIEFATMTRSWIKVMIEANSTFLREKQVGPWVQSQRELALSSLSGKPQKKSLTPASVARKTGKAFAFLRHVYSRPGDLLFDLSVEQAGLPALIEAMLTDVNESNYQLRKIRLFLMFQEVAIVSQLKVDERLAGGGYEHYLVAVVAEKFVEGMMRSWNYWLYCMIPELPISVLAVILRIGQGHLERSLEAVSVSEFG